MVTVIMLAGTLVAQDTSCPSKQATGECRQARERRGMTSFIKNTEVPDAK
jgi:hypothetical protein